MQGPEVQAGIPRNPRRRVDPVTARILRKVWHLRVAKSGFRDLENPDNPDGPLSNARVPSHLRDNASLEWTLPEPGELDDGMRRTVRAYRESSRIGIEATAEYYRQIEHLAWRFEDGTERAIAVAVSNGDGERKIKADLHVGRQRIVRVMKQIRIWMKEPREDDDGE